MRVSNLAGTCSMFELNCVSCSDLDKRFFKSDLKIELQKLNDTRKGILLIYNSNYTYNSSAYSNTLKDAGFKIIHTNEERYYHTWVLDIHKFLNPKKTLKRRILDKIIDIIKEK